MGARELEKSKVHITVELVEYVHNSVVIKTILKKTSGNISLMSFDGEGLTGITSPFDTFTQIVDGYAEIVISGISNLLQTGQSIVIPAHSPYYVKSTDRFKMIQTVIKSGYE